MIGRRIRNLHQARRAASNSSVRRRARAMFRQRRPVSSFPGPNQTRTLVARAFTSPMRGTWTDFSCADAWLMHMASIHSTRSLLASLRGRSANSQLGVTIKVPPAHSIGRVPTGLPHTYESASYGNAVSVLSSSEISLSRHRIGSFILAEGSRMMTRIPQESERGVYAYAANGGAILLVASGGDETMRIAEVTSARTFFARGTSGGRNLVPNLQRQEGGLQHEVLKSMSPESIGEGYLSLFPDRPS